MSKFQFLYKIHKEIYKLKHFNENVSDEYVSDNLINIYEKECKEENVEKKLKPIFYIINNCVRVYQFKFVEKLDMISDIIFYDFEESYQKNRHNLSFEYACLKLSYGITVPKWEYFVGKPIDFIKKFIQNNRSDQEGWYLFDKNNWTNNFYKKLSLIIYDTMCDIMIIKFLFRKGVYDNKSKIYKFCYPNLFDYHLINLVLEYV